MVPVTPLKSPLQPLYRAYFFLAFSFVYLFVLYGNSILKILSIVSVNYAIAKLGGKSRWMPALTWIFNLAILFLNEGYRGYDFGAFHPSLAWLVRSFCFLCDVIYKHVFLANRLHDLLLLLWA